MQFKPLPIPNLQKQTKNKIQELRKKLSQDQAISYDCLTHQFIKNYNWETIFNIWNEEPFQINKKLGWAKLLPLNKIYPDIPNKSQFHPIVILSPMQKFLELRFYDKLMSHLQEKILQQQTGFVKGFGAQVNIDIIKSTKASQKLMMLFIDFSSAYNTISREKLYQLLEQNEVQDKNEILYFKTIHSRIIYVNPFDKKDFYYYNNGAPQGSPISPHLFDIYKDGFLRKLQQKVKSSFKFLVYADGLVFIIKQSQLLQFLNVIRILAKEWIFRINEKNLVYSLQNANQ